MHYERRHWLSGVCRRDLGLQSGASEPLPSSAPRLRWLLDRLWLEWKQTEVDIQTITDEIERISNEDERCQRLRQIPGFGPLVSTAMVAAIGNGAAFRRGRDFAAWVGVVPRQYSTGGKQKLFGISKRGNIYLRRMLIHGARAVLFRIKYDTAGLGQWVHRLSQRAPRNKVIVAIANELAPRDRASVKRVAITDAC